MILVRRLFINSLVILMTGVTCFGQDTKPGIANDEKNNKSAENTTQNVQKTIYSARPKDAWELGIHTGYFLIDGDVDRRVPAGYGLGLHVRKAVHYVFSLRADFMYGQTSGLDPQMWSHSSKGGGLVEDVFQPYAKEDGWFPAYQTRYGYLAVQTILNVGNLIFHKERNKWNSYWAIGVGLSSHQTNLDLLDKSGRPYNGLGKLQGDFKTPEGRKKIKEVVDAVYDGKYETKSWKQSGIFQLGDNIELYPLFTASFGISRKLSSKVNLGLEHQVNLSGNDMMDGIRFRTAIDQSNNNDVSHYTNIRIGINIGDFKKVTEPLYWLNPLSTYLNDLSEVKTRPVFNPSDTDKDGVIDALDKEIQSPEGAPVDTRGVVLDSDGDGIPDYKDREPFSPPGIAVDEEGVAKITYTTMDEIQRAIDSISAGKQANSDCGKWYLPMIHFDMDKSSIKPEFCSLLHHVADVMKMCPDICITVQGHTDVRTTNDYNKLLSYDRAENIINYLVFTYTIPRERFKLMYGGEDAPLIPNAKKKIEHYINRRVEIRVCVPDDKEMPRPPFVKQKKK